MSNTYKLVNPYIKGEYRTKIKTKNSIDAAKKFYKTLSEHFNNNVPRFYFTIQKGGSGKGKFYHFEVKETKEFEEVNYSIQPYEIENEDQAIEGFITNFKKFKGRFQGGAKKRRSSKRRSSKRRSSKRRSSKKTSRKSSRRSSRKSLDDSPVSSDDFYRQAKSYVPVTSQPIYHMYYDPLVYKLDSVFIPTFYAYTFPYMEINAGGYGYVLAGLN
jgi:hypothetical protein